MQIANMNWQGHTLTHYVHRAVGPLFHNYLFASRFLLYLVTPAIMSQGVVIPDSPSRLDAEVTVQVKNSGKPYMRIGLEFEKLYSCHPSVKIITDLETDLLNISGSSVHLGESLYNLISNASEAMPKGGTVTIQTTNQYLDKPIQGYDQIKQGDYVVLDVDLMVLDMIMDPGMDGLDTYKQVLEIHPKQKAIIVSGFSESERVKAARGLGVAAYVRKPYIKEKLGLAVRKELDRI